MLIVKYQIYAYNYLRTVQLNSSFIFLVKASISALGTKALLITIMF